jgi:hypothetical protein
LVCCPASCMHAGACDIGRWHHRVLSGASCASSWFLSFMEWSMYTSMPVKQAHYLSTVLTAHAHDNNLWHASLHLALNFSRVSTWWFYLTAANPPASDVHAAMQGAADQQADGNNSCSVVIHDQHSVHVSCNGSQAVGTILAVQSHHCSFGAMPRKCRRISLAL